jgi:hypothetical protein
MIGKRDGRCAGSSGRGSVTTLPNMTDARCEALFASSLQASDGVTAEVATAEISRTTRLLGAAGCASRMAQEFGDHPEEARDRMRWARHVVSELPPVLAGPAVGPARRAA